MRRMGPKSCPILALAGTCVALALLGWGYGGEDSFWLGTGVGAGCLTLGASFLFIPVALDRFRAREGGSQNSSN